MAESEDALDLEGRRATDHGARRVAVVRLPRISNFTDLDALGLEPALDVVFVSSARDVSDADLVVLPGTRATVADLAWLRSRGLDQAITRLARLGRPVLGICGGCQMLGRVIADPDGIEGAPGVTEGLWLLDLVTTFRAEKTLRLHAPSGYEILIRLKSDIPLRRTSPVLPDGSCEAELSGDGVTVPARVTGYYADAGGQEVPEMFWSPTSWTGRSAPARNSPRCISGGGASAHDTTTRIAPALITMASIPALPAKTPHNRPNEDPAGPWTRPPRRDTPRSATPTGRDRSNQKQELPTTGQTPQAHGIACRPSRGPKVFTASTSLSSDRR